MIFAKYDKTTGQILGHYTPEIHASMFDQGNPLSDDLIALTPEQHNLSVYGCLKIIDGVATEYTPEPSPEEAKAALQSQAQALLSASDIQVLRCVENGITLPDAWKAYRCALRAIVSSGAGEIPQRPVWP